MCTFCAGTVLESTTEYVEKQGNAIVVVKNVPCRECRQCGETYFDDHVVDALENRLNQIHFVSSEITVSVIDFNQILA